MKWLVDAQLPVALARMLSDAGYDAQHVTDIGLRHAEDSAIWLWALNENAIIVTKDDDFPRRAMVSKNSPAIVWLRIGNTRKQLLLEWFSRLLPSIESEIHAGERIVEVR